MRTTFIGLAIGAAIAGGTAACSGQVATSSPSDGGPGDGPPVVEASPSYEAGPLPHDGGADGPHDSGPTPSGGDTCQSPGVVCVVPPPAPTGSTQPPGAAAHQYAIHTLYLGDTDRNGVPSSSAWKAYGYNLDGLVTTKASMDVCTLEPGASKTTQVDGNGGIDNSFGANILPIVITTAGSDFGARLNASIQAGTGTNLVYAVGFDDTAGNKTSATGLDGVLLGGGNYALLHDGGAPAWDLTTHWPVDPGSLACPNGVCAAGTDPIASAIVKFPSAYQAGGTFVSGPASNDSLVVLLGLGGTALPLSIHRALVTFDPKAPGSVTNGTIAGVLATDELINAFHAVAGTISTSLCSGSAFQSIAQQLQQASDVVFDGSKIFNAAGVPCNAISIGLGFDATEIAPPTPADVGSPTPAPPNPCGDQ